MNEMHMHVSVGRLSLLRKRDQPNYTYREALSPSSILLSALLGWWLVTTMLILHLLLLLLLRRRTNSSTSKPCRSILIIIDRSIGHEIFSRGDECAHYFRVPRVFLLTTSLTKSSIAHQLAVSGKQGVHNRHAGFSGYIWLSASIKKNGEE
jgi:hypothetical protein